MRLLLDTHTLLWWLAGDAQLPISARALIADERNEIYVSAVSAWEISTKHRLGKLPGAGPLMVDFEREIRSQGFLPLPITLPHGQRAGSLDGEHRDPFDRMLVAQALNDRMAVVSNDRALDHFGVVRVW